MRTLIPVLLTCLVAFGNANACDDHVETCEVEEWNYSYNSLVDTVHIVGVTTCNEGLIRLRLYENGKLIGIVSGVIMGHTFQAFGSTVERILDTMDIKYNIETD